MESDNFLDSYKHMGVVVKMTRLEELVKEKQKEIAKSVQTFVTATGEIFEMVDDEVVEQRYNICLGCEEFRPLTKQCKLCNCFMKMKVKFKVTECPKGLWNKE